MEIFLPIADMSLSPLLLFGLGLLGGFVSGMLGIGSGVVITPALMMVGIPPLVAVASQLNHAVGTNLMGFLSYWRQRDVDLSLAAYLLLGGILGALAEIFILKWVQSTGSVSTIMACTYVLVLGVLGMIMLIQNLRTLFRPKKINKKTVMMRHWMIYFPFHKIFMRSRTEMSVLVPLTVGFATGLLTSTLGGGNSLFMMPIVTYLIGRTSPVVNGTSLLAGFVITIAVTIVHAIHSPVIDIVLVFILLVGGTIGSQIGVKFSYALPRPYIGLIGAAVILFISLQFVIGTPTLAPKQLHLPPTYAIDGQIDLRWADMLVQMAQNSPLGYTFFAIIIVAACAILIEHVLHRLIVIPSRHRI